jgi:hypothetical protein
MGFLDDAISNLGQSLAQTAVATVSDQTGYNVGGALNALFGTGQKTGGQNLAALPSTLGSAVQDTTLLNTVLGAVTQQTNLLQALGTQLSSLAGEISAIEGEIGNLQQLLQAINQETLYLTWQDADKPISTLIATVRSAHQNYGNYIADSLGTNSFVVNTFVEGVLTPGNVISSASSDINDAIMAQGGQSQGLLQLWSEMVVPLIANGTIDYREAVSEYMDYYKRLVYAQLQATNMLMEAYNFNLLPSPMDTPTTQAKDQWRIYRGYLLAQEEPFVNSLFPLVVAAVGRAPGDFMSWGFTAVSASMELNPLLQSSPATAPAGGTTPTAYYAPSQLFREAEQLLANLYVTGPQDRRIVVYMTCIERDEYALVSDVTLTLDQNVEPAATQKTTAPFYAGGADTNWLDGYPTDAAALYLKRFVFSADANNPTLKDGPHQLTNLNGVNGLGPLPLPGTLQPPPGSSPLTVPFMSDHVVGHELTIGPSSAFDFMNFAAYTTPIPYVGYKPH